MVAGRDERISLYELGRDQGVEAAVDSIVGAADDWDDFPFPDWWSVVSRVAGPSGSINGSEDEIVAWYAAQLVGANPLGAKMFKFFVDHYPVDTRPLLNQNRYVYLFQHFDLCRRFSLGNYRALTHGISFDPAMMWMLDLRISWKGGLNENFGREVLELFTLGVDGGYTEEDVVGVTRAFTGRQTTNTIVLEELEPFLNDETVIHWRTGEPYYRFIDTDEITVLGKTFTAFAPDDGDPRTDHGPAVLDHIMDQPAAGRYLVWKLWRYFVSPDPPAGIVEELGDRFRSVHQYEIRPLLRELFRLAAFYDDAVVGNQIKDSGDYFVSCLTALSVGLPSPRQTFLAFEHLGYQPVSPPNISGWPEPIGGGNAWIGPEKILFRANLPILWLQQSLAMFPIENDLTRRSLADESPPDDFVLGKVVPAQFRGKSNFDFLLDELNDRLLPFHRLTDEQRRVVRSHYENDYRLLDESSRIIEVIRLFMSLPEFQLQ